METNPSLPSSSSSLILLVVGPILSVVERQSRVGNVVVDSILSPSPVGYADTRPKTVAEFASSYRANSLKDHYYYWSHLFPFSCLWTVADGAEPFLVERQFDVKLIPATGMPLDAEQSLAVQGA
jgi:hypothetical protein